MAMDDVYLAVLSSAIKILQESASPQTKIKAVCLSYPDLLVSGTDLNARFGEGFTTGVAVRDDSEQIRKWHSLADDFGPVYETESVFSKLGIETEFVDIMKIRGPERVIDLNELLPDDLYGRFDLVVDTGTLEHCFNIGFAFRSMCQMIKLGGYIVTAAPLTMVNHGFWNISPTAYLDAFDQNGFELQFLQGRVKGPEGIQLINFMPAPTQRVLVPPDTGIICVAKRINNQLFEWPVQTKYKAMLLPNK
jgi:hypothetical protein